MTNKMILPKIYYVLRPLIPRFVQIYLRRYLINKKRKLYGHIWPIDESAGSLPEGWPGWPDGKQFAFIIMHDVDTIDGHDRCLQLADIEEKLDFRSIFYFVPERYQVSEGLRNELIKRGFGVGVHGLNHDGKLFSSKSVFDRRAKRINKYLKQWGTEGFSSPAMHHNLDWMPALNIKHATSTFDTDPFEPQPDGVRTIFPFWAPRNSYPDGYLELPYTLPQDFTLFVLMQEKNIDIWKKKLDWIAEKGGMALFNSHPDYMNFGGNKSDFEKYPVEFYKEFLVHVKNKYKGQYWNALPKDIARFWKLNIL